jgi:hypothetical protein
MTPLTPAQIRARIQAIITGLFAGTITQVVDNGDGTQTLTLTHSARSADQTPESQAGHKLKAGYPFIIYDDDNPLSANSIWQTHTVDSIDGNTITITSDETITTDYLYKVLTPHFTMINTQRYRNLKDLPSQIKSDFPVSIAMVSGRESEPTASYGVGGDYIVMLRIAQTFDRMAGSEEDTVDFLWSLWSQIICELPLLAVREEARIDFHTFPQPGAYLAFKFIGNFV